VVVAAIGGGDGFDLHRCRGVEHEVHSIPAYSFPKYGGSLAHEFNDSILAVGLTPETVRDPKRRYANGGFAANPSRDPRITYSLSAANVALDFLR